MATLKSIIDYVDSVKPNAFSNEAKTQWVNEAEGLVQTEVLLRAIDEVEEYDWATDQDTELLARPPHDKLYRAYLTAMVDFANGEYNRYANTMQMFNAHFGEYQRWFAHVYRPADTHGPVYADAGTLIDTEWRGYYITAYGIAVKHGFKGTEAEWLESLEGKSQELAAPESYGAKGDGVSDDTDAWQAAVDSGRPVQAKAGATYKVGTITVTEDTEIDCALADFICTAGVLFDIHGAVTETLEDQADYLADTMGYTLERDGEPYPYTGMAMIRGSNVFDYTKKTLGTYDYLGGVVCQFYGGVLTESYPWDMKQGSNEGDAAVAVDLIEPVFVKLSRVGKITHVDGSGNIKADTSIKSIRITYGRGCTVEDCSIDHSGAYEIVALLKSLHCDVIRCRMTNELTNPAAANPTSQDSYPVAVLESSYCRVKDCNLYNRYHHCWSSGGAKPAYVCWRNEIDGGEAISTYQYGIVDHSNARGTIVRNMRTNTMHLTGMCLVDNVDIISSGTDTATCMIRLDASFDEKTADYMIRNVRFRPNPAKTSYAYFGIKLIGRQDSAGEVPLYMRDVSISNVKVIGTGRNGAAGRIDNVIDAGNTCHIKNIHVEDTDLILALDSYADTVDDTDYMLTAGGLARPVSAYRLAKQTAMRISDAVMSDGSGWHDIWRTGGGKICWQSYDGSSGALSGHTADYKTVSGGATVTITDAAPGGDAITAEAAITPVQAGSGDPAPDNVRAITGHTFATLTSVIGGTTSTKKLKFEPDGDPMTVYHGTIDYASGTLTVDAVLLTFDGSEDESWGDRSTSREIPIPSGVTLKTTNTTNWNSSTHPICVCSHFKPTNSLTISDADYYTIWWSTTSGVIRVKPNKTLSAFKAWLQEEAQNGRPLQLIAELAEPAVYHLSGASAPILSSGTCVLSSSTGAMTEVEYLAADGEVSE